MLLLYYSDLRFRKIGDSHIRSRILDSVHIHREYNIKVLKYYMLFIFLLSRL